METEFSKQIRKIINDKLSDSSYLDRYKKKIADEILLHTGKIDYRVKYVLMCEADDAKKCGVSLDEL